MLWSGNQRTAAKAAWRRSVPAAAAAGAVICLCCIRARPSPSASHCPTAQDLHVGKWKMRLQVIILALLLLRRAPKNLREGMQGEKNLELLKWVCIDTYCTLMGGPDPVLVDTVVCSKSNSRSLSAWANVTEIAKYLSVKMECSETGQPLGRVRLNNNSLPFNFCPFCR